MNANESVMYLGSRRGRTTEAVCNGLAGVAQASAMSRSMSSLTNGMADTVRSTCIVEVVLASIASVATTVVLELQRVSCWGSLAATWDQVGVGEGGGGGAVLHWPSALIPSSLCLCNMRLLLKRFCWLESRSCNALASWDHGENSWDEWIDSGARWLKALKPIWEPGLRGWNTTLLWDLKSADVKCIPAGGGGAARCIVLTGPGSCIDCRKGETTIKPGGPRGFNWAPAVWCTSPLATNWRLFPS